MHIQSKAISLVTSLAWKPHQTMEVLETSKTFLIWKVCILVLQSIHQHRLKLRCVGVGQLFSRSILLTLILLSLFNSLHMCCVVSDIIIGGWGPNPTWFNIIVVFRIFLAGQLLCWRLCSEHNSSVILSIIIFGKGMTRYCIGSICLITLRYWRSWLYLSY